MTKGKKLVYGEIIYKSGIRYHAPKYPYKILVESNGKGGITIYNYSINDERVTHGVGFKIGDLERILKNLKKL